MTPRWEIPGFDFRPDGAFRKWARQVAARRAALLAHGQIAELNAPVATGSPAPSSAAVSGTVHIPAVLFQYTGGTLPAGPTGRDTSNYTSVLFGSSPPAGSPYTERTFYEQMSNGLLSLQGNALGYVTLDSGENFYAGAPGTCNGSPFGGHMCNGLFSGTAIAHMQSGLVESLRKVDSIIHPDWSVYDYDPTTGELNLVIFVQPAMDGACGPQGVPANHLWSHRFFLNTAYTTKTPWPGHAGQFLRIFNYTLQSGVGGPLACGDSTKIMPIGTATHETGHAFGLPDLYDVSQASEGVGEWSLMGSGNYTAPYSPSRMDVWSLNQLGWVTVVPLMGGGNYRFGPSQTSDTAFLVHPRGANPRGEYYLLENRQAVLADTSMIRIHCAVSGSPAGCGGGMLVWHVDSEEAAQCGTLNTNCMNSESIHGLELVQADGDGNLDVSPGSVTSNRGDAGDPFPGVKNKHTFGPPQAVLNHGGGYVGFTVDSITQVTPGGTMSFTLRFATITTITSNDTGAVIQLDGVAHHRIQVLLDSGSTHTIAVADTQVRGDSLVRYVFQSWSDAGALSHSITISGLTDSVSALLDHTFRTKITFDTAGSVTSDRDSALTGAYMTPGTMVSFAAHPHAGSFFLGWTGDTTTVDSTLLLTLTRPYNLHAAFSAPLSLLDVRQQVLFGSSPLTVAQRAYLDQIGNKNSVLGDVGDFLAWVRLTHPVPPSAPLLPTRTVAVKGGQP
jgi:M6 family metalloprotease-like protein